MIPTGVQEIQDKLFLPTLDQIYTFTGKRLELGKDYSFYASENDYRRNIWASYSNAGKPVSTIIGNMKI